MKTLTLTIKVTEEEYQAFKDYLDRGNMPSISFKHIPTLSNKKDQVMTNDKHKKLYGEAMAAINKLFGDQSVPQSETRHSLDSLIDEIQIMLEALEA